MARILIVTMDGCGPDLDYGIYRMKEEKLEVTVAALKNVPTMAEQGFPAATMTSQFGLAAPARTPEPVIQRLNEAFAKAARDPDVVRKTIDDGIELAPSSPAEFSAMIEKEFEKLDMLLKPSAAARK